jgi:hypothetical protein
LNPWSLQFDPPDLADWLWPAVLALGLAELFHYLRHGRRPARVGGRFVVCAAVVVLATTASAAGLLGPVRANPPAAAGLLGVLLVPALARAYGRTTRALGLAAWSALLALRLLAVAVVLVLLARPVVEYVTITRERGSLAILLDDSRSMTIRDVPPDRRRPEAAPPIARLEAVRAALSEQADALAGLAGEVDLCYFAFDAQARPLPAPKLTGGGEQTALAAALEQVRVALEAGGSQPVGMVVISDGRDNFSGDDEQRTAGESLAAGGIPLYTVGVGSELPVGQNRGLLARRLDCPESVAVLNRLPVRAEFVATGLAGTVVSIELLWDDAVVELQQVRPAGPVELLRVNLGHTPNAGGLHRVGVRGRAAGLAGPQGESGLSQFVRVTDEKVQVLYVDRPRYERAAIARALEAAAELRVTKVDLHRPGGGSPALLPRSGLEWKAYHVVLLGDVDREALTDATLGAIRDLVLEQGRGVAMLGGIRTLGSGPYDGSPLSGLIPVSLGAGGQLPGPVAFELTPSGRQHAACRLLPDAAGSMQLWKRLPAFDGADRLAGLAPAAEVLMHAPAGEPLLVVAEAGRGRAAAVAFDSTWRWSFADARGLEAQRRFWRQLVLWLANRRPEVWVAADRPRYDLTRLRSNLERVTLRAGVTEPTTGRMPDNASLTGTLTGPDGKARELRWVRSGDALTAQPSLTAPGEYHVRVSARAGDKPLGESETAFVVVTPDPELADPTADLENLRRLAARTRAAGGEYVPLEEFGRLIERLSTRKRAALTRHVRRENLVDDRPWLWFGVFVGLLTVEWIARRRLGLV